MTEDETLEVIDDFRPLVIDIGDEVVDEFSGEQDGQSVRGIRCHHGDNPFLVYALEGNNFVSVQFQYRVLNDFVAAQLENVEEHEKVVVIDTEERPELMEDAHSEMMGFLNSIDEDVAQRFYIDILQKLKNDSVGYEVYEHDENLIQGFEVNSHLFPLEDEITLKEFYDAVQSVLSIGVPTRAYIQYSYGLRQDAGGPPVHGDLQNVP